MNAVTTIDVAALPQQANDYAAADFLKALHNLTPQRMRCVVDFMSRDPTIPPAECSALRALYDLPALGYDDADLPTLIAQWDEEEAALAR